MGAAVSNYGENTQAGKDRPAPVVLPPMFEKAWAGAVTVAIGGGPSLTQAQVDYCRGRAKVIAINDAVRLAPWADLLYFCDERWYRWHEAEVKAFRGIRATLENGRLESELPGLISFKNAGTSGCSLTPGALATGRNSGYQAIQVAAQLGVSKLVLIGFDMKAVDGRSHWFGEHPSAGSPDRFEKNFAPLFDQLARPMELLGMRVVNATPGSALRLFPREPLEEALP